MTKAKRTLANLELVGGNLCLDFANTVNVRPVPEHDYLSSYQALLEWSGKVGTLEPQHIQQLAQRALAQPGAAQDVLARAHRLRDLVYRTFSRVAAQAIPDDSDLQGVQALYGQACTCAELVWRDARCVLEWGARAELEAVLWPLGYAAGELLRADELARLKECPSCGWLFVDSSKNGQRRWCSMNTCGVRDKMHRYHQRLRAQDPMHGDRPVE
jgi:predicted RNA-binding Zn ribbon-like protein